MSDQENIQDRGSPPPPPAGGAEAPRLEAAPAAAEAPPAAAQPRRKAPARRKEKIRSSAGSRPRSRPTQKHQGLTWLLLGIIVLLALPALLIELGEPDASDPEELRLLAQSVQTYRRIMEQNDPTATLGEKLVPYLNDQPQFRDPPGAIWAQMSHYAVVGAMAPVESPDYYIYLARLGAVVAAVFSLAFVYWAGHGLGGARTGALAALVMLASPLLLYHGRIATDAIHHLAWSTLSIAAALWATRPLRPRPKINRQFFGWLTCGLALGMAILMQGWSALPGIVLPVFLILVLCPDRVSHLLGLLAATLVGVLMVLPWAVFAHVHDREAWHLAVDHMPSSQAWFPVYRGEIPLRLLTLLGVLLPWSWWLLAAIAQPLSSSSSGGRLRLSLGWAWFGSSTFLFLVTSRGRYADMLPIIPGAAVLVALLFRQYIDLAAEARYPRVWRLFRWPHIIALAVGSLAVASAPWTHARLVELSLVPVWLFGHPGPVTFGAAAFWMVLGAVLLAVTVMAIRWSVKEYPGRVLVCCCIWQWLLLTMLAIPLSHGPLGTQPAVAQAREVARISSDQPLYWLRSSERESEHPALPLQVYLNRTVSVLPPEQVGLALVEQGSIDLVADRDWSPRPGTRGRRVGALPLYQRVVWRLSSPEAAGPAADQSPPRDDAETVTPEGAAPATIAAPGAPPGTATEPPDPMEPAP